LRDAFAFPTVGFFAAGFSAAGFAEAAFGFEAGFFGLAAAAGFAEVLRSGFLAGGTATGSFDDD
jgi:hypothetical protein